MTSGIHLVKVKDYEQYVGKDVIERIREKARPLKGLKVAHLNSTYYGGGVAMILDSLTLLMNDLGIKAEWRTIQGAPDFFSITKKMHNALQGAKINLTDLKIEIYENINHKNSLRTHLNHDYVVIHDPQPLPFIEFYRKNCPWIWHCHLDLTEPNQSVWEYLKQFIEKYDVTILSTKEYKQPLNIPQLIFMPAIDPFTLTNRELTEKEVNERLDHHKIPRDLPIICQISRFDTWKDPEGVIRAFLMARKQVDATLVLLGNVATDDPEGEKVYQSLLNFRSERILIMSREDTALVNALQRKAAVIVQKSLREGFGLTVAEAMWKKTAVIGGNVGGIRYQIQNGINGFLVSSIEETAERMIQLIKDETLRKIMGEKAHETVRDNFLMIRLLEQYLDLFNSIIPCFKLK